METPEVALIALSVIRPFLTAVTSFNPSYSLHSALAATYNLSLQGSVVGLSFALSTSGINVRKGLLEIQPETGYRAFDAFYYLLTSTSTAAEREFLDLKDPAEYTLLNRSNTYNPPHYLPTADDAAAAEDFRASLKSIGIKGLTDSLDKFDTFLTRGKRALTVAAAGQNSLDTGPGNGQNMLFHEFHVNSAGGTVGLEKSGDGSIDAAGKSVRGHG